MSNYENLRLEIDGVIATITIARPKSLNALNAATIDELGRAVEEVAGNSELRGLILTGEGTKAFVAGADISSMKEMSGSEAEAFSKRAMEAFTALEALSIPVVAAVNGFALGGGCELALTADFIYAAENARFGQPEVNLGLVPGFGGTQRLARKVPYGMAMELLLSGDMIDAEEARRIGLVNHVFPQDELLGAARKILDTIATRGPIAVDYTKRVTREGLDRPLREGLELEATYFGRVFETTDAREGMSAFLEKRKADFKGE